MIDLCADTAEPVGRLEQARIYTARSGIHYGGVPALLAWHCVHAYRLKGTAAGQFADQTVGRVEPRHEAGLVGR